MVADVMRDRYRFVRRSLALAALALVVMAAPADGTGRSTAGLPALDSNGVGPAHFGASKHAVISLLRPLLGRPNAAGTNTGCRKKVTEIAWHDLIAEFRGDTFSGYRFIRGGWPLQTPGSPRDHVSRDIPLPPLRTEAGITLGSTFAELRSAYPELRRSAAVTWKARNGLTFTLPSTVANVRSPTNPIIEIQTKTCGAF